MSTKPGFDFSGYATRNGLRCSDGRTIVKGAFAHQNGDTVPLVWQHSSSTPETVIGQVLLEDRPDGTYCHGKFNNSDYGQRSKALVKHGDITSLSIKAGSLVEKTKNVIHGKIHEVSLVLAGANPGALIDAVTIMHADGMVEIVPDTGIIYSGQPLVHSDDAFLSDPLPPSSSLNDSALIAIMARLNDMSQSSSMSHAQKERTIKDVFDDLTEEQKQVVYYMIGQSTGVGEAKHLEDGGYIMKHNVFDTNESEAFGGSSSHTKQLTHKEFGAILSAARDNKTTSLRDTFVEHATNEYGLEPIDILFPEARNVDGAGPQTWKRPDDWVAGVLRDIKKTPFSRIKTVIADLHHDDARARGYITGNRKKEEIIPLMKRVTTPTTIYKKQKLDRDDIIDITDFNVVAWLRREMREMLDEELARAILIGDGRDVSDPDKINDQNIRPIYTDNSDIFVVEHLVSGDANHSTIIDEFVRARIAYRGSGKPTLYTSTALLTEMLLLKDGLGRKIYMNEADLAATLRVSSIVEVEVMNDIQREVDGSTRTLLGIVVNLSDYTIGADRGGEIAMFDDFDIDFNQYKYLIETRCSGALTRPKSAIVVEQLPDELAVG